MRVKSNVPLSDNEMRRVRDVLNSTDKFTIEITRQIADIFPYTDINISDGVLYIGKPPWDITQEIPLPNHSIEKTERFKSEF